MRSKAVFLLCFVVLASTPLALSAQVGTELTVTLTPEHPRPGEAFTVSVESYNIDLNRADMRWYVSDKLTRSGVGVKSLAATAGHLGETTAVRVTALGENGGVYSASVTIRPAEVNLLWQAESYTPPFYKGKALMPYQGTVLVAAVPWFVRSSLLPAGSLIYTWKEGDEVIGDSSGKGKNLFVFRGGVPMRTKTISVTVESPDHTMIADASIDVSPVAPRLLFYEEHPLYGLRTKALVGSFKLEEEETRITAIPYYFETSGRAAADIAYDWELNFQPIRNARGSSVALRRASRAAGESTLFVEAHLTDQNRSFQASEEQLTISFPEQAFAAPEHGTP